MTNIKKLEPPKNDVKECLEKVLKETDGMECIIVLAIKNGEQFVSHSTSSGFQLSFMTQALQAYMHEWFYERDS